jgi:hypothetical protein
MVRLDIPSAVAVIRRCFCLKWSFTVICGSSWGACRRCVAVSGGSTIPGGGGSASMSGCTGPFRILAKLLFDCVTSPAPARCGCLAKRLKCLNMFAIKYSLFLRSCGSLIIGVGVKSQANLIKSLWRSEGPVRDPLWDPPNKGLD